MFAEYWAVTDAVSKTLFFVLIALSLASWVVAITRLLQSYKIAGSIADDLNQHINQASN